MAEDDYFGFVSLEALTQWFPEDIRRQMPVNGMRVSVYEIDPELVFQGGRQLIFKHKKSTLLYWLDPVHFMRIESNDDLAEFAQRLMNYA